MGALDPLYISEGIYDLSDRMRWDYPQPNCPACGRFARREGGPGSFWVLDYMTYVRGNACEHDYTKSLR